MPKRFISFHHNCILVHREILLFLFRFNIVFVIIFSWADITHGKKAPIRSLILSSASALASNLFSSSIGSGSITYRILIFLELLIKLSRPTSIKVVINLVLYWLRMFIPLLAILVSHYLFILKLFIITITMNELWIFNSIKQLNIVKKNEHFEIKICLYYLIGIIMEK